jgi:autotransporter-associated beta strand protein
VLAVTKAGTGTQTFSGIGLATGAHTVNGGTLHFAKTTALYNGSAASWTAGNIIVNSGAALGLSVGGVGEFSPTQVGTITSLGTASGGLKNGAILSLDTTNAGIGLFTLATALNNTNSGSNVITLRKTGANTLRLTADNTFSGATDVVDGTLEIAATAGRLSQTSSVNVTGGTLLLSGTQGDLINNSSTIALSRNTAASASLKLSGTITETLGAMTLADSVQVIDLGSGAGILTLASLSGSSNSKLQIWNYSGVDTIGGGTDQLIVTAGILAGAGFTTSDVEFYSGAGTGFIGNGSWSVGGNPQELVPVPEPSTLAGGVAILGAVGLRLRRRR